MMRRSWPTVLQAVRSNTVVFRTAPPLHCLRQFHLSAPVCIPKHRRDPDPDNSKWDDLDDVLDAYSEVSLDEAQKKVQAKRRGYKDPNGLRQQPKKDTPLPGKRKKSQPAPPPVFSFSEFGLPPELETCLTSELGFTSPTPIQSHGIPVVARGDPIVFLAAPTGTGKTMAFSLPIVAKIFECAKDPDVKPPRALILCTTRELAVQTYLELSRVAPKQEVVLGSDDEALSAALTDAPPALVVTSPRVVLEALVGRAPGVLPYICSLTHVVVDEADHAFKPLGKYAPQKEVVKRNKHPRPVTILMAEIAKRNPKFQLICASATINSPLKTEVRKRNWLKAEPLVVRIGAPQEIPDAIVHRLEMVQKDEHKIPALARIFSHERKHIKGALAFFQEGAPVQRIIELLEVEGIKGALLQTVTPEARKELIAGVQSGKFDVIVADAGSVRGMDFPAFSHVFIMTCPKEPANYLHMAGRVGRQGVPGRAISILNPKETRRFQISRGRLGIHHREWYPEETDDILPLPPFLVESK